MNQTYSGRVKAYDKKADGSTLVIGKGDRKGEPYYKISFKQGDEWINLMDFDGVTGGQDGEYSVEYYQKFLPNGDPDLYPKGENEDGTPKGKPQYQLVSIAPLNGQTQAKSAPAAAQGGTSQQEDIRAAVAAKCASEIVATRSVFDPSEWDAIYKHILGTLSGKTIEQEAMEKLGATVEDDDPDDLPF